MVKSFLFFALTFSTFITADPVLLKRIRVLENKLSEIQSGISLENTDSYEEEDSLSPVHSSPTLLSKINFLEENLQSLTGRIEEINHKVEGIQNKISTIEGDMNIRFQEIETSLKILKTLKSSLNDSSPKEESSNDPNPSHILPGFIKVPVQSIASLSRDKISKLSEEDVQKNLFLEAKSYFETEDFLNSEKLFKRFLKEHEKSEYAPSASYWLGQTYLKAHQPKKAAVIFKNAFVNYPKSRRVCENLFGLAQALSIENRKNACITLTTLIEEDLPHKTASIKEQAFNLSKKLKCSS